MLNRVDHLERRLLAIEALLDLPRRVPILLCDECGIELADLGCKCEQPKTCPSCGCHALRHDRSENWPPVSADRSSIFEGRR